MDLGTQFGVLNEWIEMFPENLGSFYQSQFGGHGAVCPDFQGDFIVVGFLSHACFINFITYACYRTKNGVDGNNSNFVITATLFSGGHVATTILDHHFHHKGDVVGQVSEYEVRVDDFHVGVCLDITGQDGSYLAEFLLEKGYEIHGIVRRSSTFNRGRIEHLRSENSHSKDNFHLHYGDLLDFQSMDDLVATIRPNEIYNLAAQSHVAISFKTSEYTCQVNAMGPLRLLHSLVANGLNETCRFYQASTSEMFGKVMEIPQTEKTPFYPRSPYGIAKVYGHWTTINYREAFNVFACNGIMFNHESPRRGENFVSRKITLSLAKILAVLVFPVPLGPQNRYA